MIWFGSSAGVALSNQYPQIRSVAAYLRHGWHVIIAYIIGFIALLLILGWHPTPKKSDLEAFQLANTHPVTLVSLSQQGIRQISFAQH